MSTTKIEWTDRVWNPLTGCTKVSPGCDHCYAKTMHERFNGPGSFDTITLHPERLDQPSRWRKPSLVFVNSMSDLFHQDVPDEFISRVFNAMEQSPEHTFQLLTKRHSRMRSFLTRRHASNVDYATQFSYCPTDAMRNSPAAKWAQHRVDNPWPNVWIGVSVEDQQWANIRIPALLDTPATVRFLSCEPLLGPVDLAQSLALWRPGDDQPWSGSRLNASDVLHWVITGGESGRGARPMHPDWARSLRDQCVAAGVPFLHKQNGEWRDLLLRDYDGDQPLRQTHKFDALTTVVRVGKKNAGRELDGRTWDEYPERAARYEWAVT